MRSLMVAPSLSKEGNKHDESTTSTPPTKRIHTHLQCEPTPQRSHHNSGYAWMKTDGTASYASCDCICHRPARHNNGNAVGHTYNHGQSHNPRLTNHHHHAYMSAHDKGEPFIAQLAVLSRPILLPLWTAGAQRDAASTRLATRCGSCREL